MANHPFATASPGATSTSRAPCAAPSTGKLTCLCSPTNHPGSFRCTRHRNPRGRPESSSSGGASHQSAASCASATACAEGVIRSGGGRTTKGRSVLRAHLLRLVSAPPSAGRDHRRCRDFMPRPSRLGRLAVTA